METDKKTDGGNLQQMDGAKSEEELELEENRSTRPEFFISHDSDITDKYGVIYSQDGTKALATKNDIKGSYVVHEGVKIIVEFVFMKCRSMTEIYMPDSLTSIGDMAFFECASLKEITIPKNVTHLTGNPFTGLKV